MRVRIPLNSLSSSEGCLEVKILEVGVGHVVIVKAIVMYIMAVEISVLPP